MDYVTTRRALRQQVNSVASDLFPTVFKNQQISILIIVAIIVAAGIIVVSLTCGLCYIMNRKQDQKVFSSESRKRSHIPKLMSLPSYNTFRHRYNSALSRLYTSQNLESSVNESDLQQPITSPGSNSSTSSQKTTQPKRPPSFDFYKEQNYGEIQDDFQRYQEWYQRHKQKSNKIFSQDQQEPYYSYYGQKATNPLQYAYTQQLQSQSDRPPSQLRMLEPIPVNPKIKQKGSRKYDRFDFWGIKKKGGSREERSQASDSSISFSPYFKYKNQDVLQR